MERIFSQSKSTRGIFSDPAHRMSQRPLAVKSGEGRGFEVISSGLKLKVANAKPSKSKSMSAVKQPPKPSVPPPIADDESDDEILLSSQPSTGGHAMSPLKRVPKGKKQVLSSAEEETVRVDGRVLAAHPDYKPSAEKAIKGLRFTKNKKNARGDDVVQETPPPSSSLAGSQDLSMHIPDEVEILDSHSSRRPSAQLSKHREASSTRRSPTAGRAPTAKDPCIQNPSAPTAKDAPPAKPRPRPRVIIKSTLRKRSDSPEATPRPAAPKGNIALRSKSPEPPANVDKKRTAKKPYYPPSPRREPQEFPMSLQAKDNVSESSCSSDTSTRKTKNPTISRGATVVQTSKQIPLPSPLGEKLLSRGSTFLNLSPLSSQENPVAHGSTFLNLSSLSPSNGKGKARAETSEEDSAGLAGSLDKRGCPKPFPMSSQMFTNVDKRATSPSPRGPRSTKRLSSDDSDTKQGRSAKKHKDSRSEVLDMMDHLHEPMEDDSIDMGYARDPSKICPYCDEDLPSHPTPLFQHLLATARKKSVPDPRPRNRGGLRAPLTVYISVCQRHRFESHQLPIATKKGWPKTIDFTKVPARVKKMKKVLESIVLDKDDISDAEDSDLYEGNGPRSKSVFWREVKKEVKKQGIRTVVGVKGQFASFEKTQPGYYGEQGSVIIHQTLFDLFPPSTFDASLISPLTPAEFIQRILVPEAAVRLIAQDLRLDIEDAVVTLRESAQYGVAMFPDTSENRRKGADIDDDEEIGVADRIVMERARARRKELEEEERLENEMLEKEHAAQRARARESRREKAWERAQQVKQAKARAEDKIQAGDLSEASDADGARKARPKVGKQAPRDDSESDAMSVDDFPGKRSTARPVKKKMPVDERESAGVTLELHGTDSETENRPNTRRKKGRKRSAESNTRVETETAMPSDQNKPSNKFASLDIGDEHENTPRPVRRPTTTAGTAAGGLDARIFSLQAARNRPGMSGSTTNGGWSRNLRTGVDDTDSDVSNASRRSRRLIGPSIKKGDSYKWLISGSSDSADSS